MTEDKRTEKRKIGDAGEDAACTLLAREGYKVVFRNYGCRIGEIDIVAVHPVEGVLAFVEVKTRRDTHFGLPCEAVGREKQRKLKLCANYFMLREKAYSHLQPSMDIVEILHTDLGLFGRHLKNAF